MANSFKTYASRNIGTTLQSVGGHFVASSITETIIGLTAANRTAGAINVDIIHEDNANNQTYIIKNAPVPSGSALTPIGGDQKLVITHNEAIRVRSNTANSLDTIMSVLEQT